MQEWKFVSKDGRPISIRPANTNDARNIFDGFKSVVDEGVWLPTFSPNSTLGDWIHWIQRTSQNREIFLVSLLDGVYAGHLTLQPEEWMASGHVARLGIIVVEEHRRVGVGRALMMAAEEAAHAEGFEKIILSTFDSNDLAKSLYDSMGYRVVGYRMKHFKMPDGYINEVLYEKELLRKQNV
ncbi:MAG: GNAT family N-acetyltransferase [Candidatus Thorarchaeota archaeon]|nr:MAG: GNAT family N-acetyltransferase [Candidatus Thorarchaeota archaeon]